jgi:membrane protein
MATASRVHAHPDFTPAALLLHAMAHSSPEKPAVEKAVEKLDPTAPRRTQADRGHSFRRPKMQALVRRAQGSLPADLLRRFIDTELMAQSAALALYAMLSLAPLLLILVWLTSALVPGAQESLMQQIGLLAGGEAERVARTVVDNARDRPDTGSIAGWWSVALLFIGATAVFAQLQDVLNKIFRTDATRLAGATAWLRKRVFSLGLVLAMGFLLLVSMTISTLVQLAFSRMEWALPIVMNLTTWAVYALSFALMYHYLPDRSVGWKRALGGGAITALLFALGRWLIGWYLEESDPGSAYGSMGALVLALVWMYYAALIVFVGALITAVIDERRRHGTQEAREPPHDGPDTAPEG